MPKRTQHRFLGERFQMIELGPPTIVSKPDPSTPQALRDVVGKLAPSQQFEFAEIVLAGKTIAETAEKYKSKPEVVREKLVVAIAKAEGLLQTSKHESAAAGLQLLAHYRDSLNAKAPTATPDG